MSCNRFPDVAELRVHIEARSRSGDGPAYTERFTENTLPSPATGLLPCAGHCGPGGGLRHSTLYLLVTETILKQAAERAAEVYCQGAERASPAGNALRKCATVFSVRITARRRAGAC